MHGKVGQKQPREGASDKPQLQVKFPIFTIALPQEDSEGQGDILDVREDQAVRDCPCLSASV